MSNPEPVTLLPAPLLAKLIEWARRQTIDEDEDGNFKDDVVVDDYAGGNVDDAYVLGIRDGKTDLARSVLTALNIPYGDH